MEKPSVLFVCLGNICRSPAAEGVLKRLVEDDPRIQGMHVASCGIGDWHVGKKPDERMCKAAGQRGIRLESRAQMFRREWFETYDYILAADTEVLEHLSGMAVRAEHRAKLALINAYSERYAGKDVPDPYYGRRGDFDFVLDMLEDACSGLIAHICG